MEDNQSGTTAQSEPVTNIPVDKVFRSPFQPREHFDETQLNELAESIKASGLLQPIIVRMVGTDTGTFELIAGERRLRAHKLIQRETIHAIIRTLNDEEASTLVAIENLQRADLTPMEEAKTVDNTAKQHHGNLQVVAEKLGKSLNYVTDRLAMLELPREVQHMLDEGKINFAAAKVVLELEGEKVRIEAAKLAVKLNLTAAQLRGRVQRLIQPKGGSASGTHTKGVNFNNLSTGVVRLYDVLEKFDFDMLRDKKKRETLSKQVGILQKSLVRALELLNRPIEAGETEPAEAAQARSATRR
ncbi:MAG: hypothetical protein A3I39_02860 [Candidatus Yanofskybacteria bacterium RIFCSPLOWO2_02_FULL_47_9b]|uniref:ParB-like N-terminal domain-containing protein n=1 Tax=Candidatus Yanofskybacteria bacterium RIFCSPLOWO2_02_FULL_47_9b TaxID=1802708 RepID=A0A1F8H6F6_9BACT|nr:MAG: hypothetical protein A3I39_02860 [Candidatus Yanofskybacteria bacterium RIFCSPLOWO2_02_FULL_47_9b]